MTLGQLLSSFILVDLQKVRSILKLFSVRGLIPSSMAEKTDAAINLIKSRPNAYEHITSYHWSKTGLARNIFHPTQ